MTRKRTLQCLPCYQGPINNLARPYWLHVLPRFLRVFPLLDSVCKLTEHTSTHPGLDSICPNKQVTSCRRPILEMQDNGFRGRDSIVYQSLGEMCPILRGPVLGENLEKLGTMKRFHLDYNRAPLNTCTIYYSILNSPLLSPYVIPSA